LRCGYGGCDCENIKETEADNSCLGKKLKVPEIDKTQKLIRRNDE
jgi:hypothetical protein